jgi:translation initiation factor 2 alpha subunit (eIF-2alpha)
MAKALLEEKFNPPKRITVPTQRLHSKEFPSAGDLVVVGVLLVTNIAAECILLEYADTTGFLLLKHGVSKVLSPGDIEVAYVLRANKDSGILHPTLSDDQSSSNYRLVWLWRLGKSRKSSNIESLIVFEQL